MIRTLRETLAGLYWKRDDAHRVAEDAGLDVLNIAFSEVPNQTWFSILKQAGLQRRVQALLDVALHDYPENRVLQEGRQATPAPDAALWSQTAGATPLRDARGVGISAESPLYQYFHDDRYAPLAHNLITYETLIEEKTLDFTGRRFVFETLDSFLAANSSGYFIIKGEAGIGKSALMAYLARTRGYVHHFVIGTQGINRADQFLENICAQLIAAYALESGPQLPPNATRDSAFLVARLQEVSTRLQSGQRAVILVDALDEVDWRGHMPIENVLYLPPDLPPGIFIVASSRHKQDMSLQVTRSQVFYLDADSPQNREDVRTYIAAFARRPGMQVRLQSWDSAEAEFVETMAAKSEGNFMYLRHVLPAIERGAFEHGTLAELPQGLKDYYERHWRQMRAMAEDDWINYRQPVICYLAVAREPVTVRQIADWAHLPAARVLAAIRDWREFLDEESGGDQKRYRIYHASFQDFLAAKDEAQEINLQQFHSAVADELLRQYLSRSQG